MIRSKFFSRFIVVTLTAALLLISGSRAISVSALAELAPEIAPVFDTQIYQLQDYIDHGGMTDPQLDIFYMLCGFYALGQAGSEDYKLTNPYSTQGGVLNWLKDVGVETYNTLIGLTPDTVVLPNGSIQSTDVLKKAASMYVANLMGCALKAADYDTVQEFEDDLNNSENFYIPWNKSTQYGLNTMFQTYGGIYNWQFDTEPFISNFTWNTRDLGSYAAQYNSYLSSFSSHRVRTNQYTDNYNCIYDFNNFSQYHNLFLNTSNGSYYVCNDQNETMQGSFYQGYISISNVKVLRFTGSDILYNSNGYTAYFRDRGSINLSQYSTYVDAVRHIFNIDTLTPMSDYVDTVYVGDSWANRNQIFNVQSLNFDDNDNQQYYTTVPDDTDYLLDIKGILQDILNNTNLYNVFINNIYTPDGVLVHDTDLIKVSVSLLELYQQQNPPLPINLNDIVEYTDNTYLDMVKERAKAAGSTLANLVAFWHNCDFELIYVLFGAGITVLIGAFIGKWGHS